STWSGSTRIMRRPIRPGGPRRSRLSTTQKCGTSSCICTGCSTRTRPGPRRPADHRPMRSLRELTRSTWVQRASGLAAARYLRLVWATNRLVIDPPDIYDRISPHAPIILAFWHGQHFLMPFVKPKDWRAKVLISRHRDGEINAVAARSLGIE